MAIVIQGIGKALPAKKLANDDLDKKLETSDEWIRSHTGIGSRYIAAPEETSATLGVTACKQALQRAALKTQTGSIDIKDINLIICATATSQFKGFPSNACVMQEKLGAENAVCFDISAACTGFIYGLDTAAALMERNNWRYALICGSEVLSRIMDWTDRATCVLFGDGAGAVLLENIDTTKRMGFGAAVLGSDGTGAPDLYADERGFITMNGRAVYNFAVKVITDTIQKLFQKENLEISDIDLIVCHQANVRIIQAAAKRLGFPMGKFICNMEEYGNTSSASIPITLADLEDQGLLKKGMKIIIAGFGAGLTWGGCTIQF